MKESSIKKLQEVLSITRNGSVDRKEATRIYDYVSEVLVAEAMQTEARVNKFNIYEYVASKKEPRKHLRGVYHTEGFQVATNGCILVKSREYYPEELEGKIVLQDGSFVEERYPNFNAVIPSGPARGVINIDFDAFKQGLKKAREEHFIKCGKKIKFDDLWVVKAGDLFFRAEWFDLLLSFAKHKGITQIQSYDPNRPCKVSSDDGSEAIIMPLIPDWSGNVIYRVE